MKEAKPKSFKQVFAKDVTAEVERVRTYHLNDDDRTEVEKDDGSRQSKKWKRQSKTITKTSSGLKNGHQQIACLGHEQ